MVFINGCDSAGFDPFADGNLEPVARSMMNAFNTDSYVGWGGTSQYSLCISLGSSFILALNDRYATVQSAVRGKETAAAVLRAFGDSIVDTTP